METSWVSFFVTSTMANRKELQRRLKPYIARGEIQKILNDGLEFACLDADHRGVKKKGKDFIELCIYSLYMALESAYVYVTDELPTTLQVDTEDLIGTNIRVPRPTTDDLKNMVMAQYESKHWFDYMPQESFTTRQRELFNDMVIRSNKAYGWKDHQVEENNG